MAKATVTEEGGGWSIGTTPAEATPGYPEIDGSFDPDDPRAKEAKEAKP